MPAGVAARKQLFETRRIPDSENDEITEKSGWPTFHRKEIEKVIFP
jgi:hypothetical protein